MAFSVKKTEFHKYFEMLFVLTTFPNMFDLDAVDIAALYMFKSDICMSRKGSRKHIF